MDRMYAHIAAGATAAADARARVHQGLGLGWQSTFPCENSAFSMITGTKRQPRRLGQRST